MGAAFEAGIKANFENAEITFDKFHVIKLANEAVDQVRREEARNNFQIKGRRYIFLKNVDHLTQEEKEALSRLEAQNLDTIQAMQIRMNLNSCSPWTPRRRGGEKRASNCGGRLQLHGKLAYPTYREGLAAAVRTECIPKDKATE